MLHAVTQTVCRCDRCLFRIAIVAEEETDCRDKEETDCTDCTDNMTVSCLEDSGRMYDARVS